MNKFKIIFISLSVLSFVILSSCNRDGNSFGGIIYELDSTNLANGAKVELIKDMQVFEEKTTDASGEYLFEDLPEGLYFVEATLEGEDTLTGNSRKFHVMYGDVRDNAHVLLHE